MFIPNVPVTFPLRFPLKPKLPVSEVVSPAKQWSFEVNEKLVTATPPLPASVKVVVKA